MAEWTEQWICDSRGTVVRCEKYDRMRHYVAMSIYLMVAFAVSMTIGFEIANRPILHLMNYSEEIMPM